MGSEEFTSDERVTYTTGDRSSLPELRFLHYNDVYHVDPSSAEPVGGIARFQHLVNHYRDDEKFRKQPDLITLFSGDAFNPSLESSVTKGSHMVPILNNIGTSCACVGNHDLDFGVPQFRTLTSQCTFPWLLANVDDPALGEGVSLGSCAKTQILTSSNGLRIGLIGLVEREWLDTINSLPPNLIYHSASATAKELVPQLREQGAEIVVAITHQREPNDNKLASQTEGLIDLIVGGHDHFYQHSLINGTHVLRSGTDFKQLSYIEARRRPADQTGRCRWDFTIMRRDVVSHVPQDAPTLRLVDKLTASLRASLGKPVGYTLTPLDARFTTVRMRESNLGNFVCDLMRFHYSADCCIMAAGTIRGDQVYAPGVLRLKDLLDCFPFEDPVVVIRASGKAIWDALENAVGKYPALEGRFPQVSNIEFEFDPQKPDGSRISYVNIGAEPLNPAKHYSLATRGYMIRGKDGYTSLLSTSAGGAWPELVSEENGVLISTILRQYFMSLKVLGRWKNWDASLGQHWAAVQEGLHQAHPVAQPKVPDEAAVQSFTATANSEERRTMEGAEAAGERMLGREEEEEELLEDDDDEDDDDDDDEHTTFDVKPVATAVSRREHELAIMRKVMRKWWRLAGLPGHPRLCDELGESEFAVHWTKAIAPRLEGRIRIVGEDEHGADGKAE